MQRTVSVSWDSPTPPTLFWRLSDQREFQAQSVGRSSDGWYHFDLEIVPDQLIACYLSDGALRFPEVGHYKFRTRHAFVKDGEVFHYMPAPEMEGPARDYEARAPLEIHSEILKEKRKVRVYLPRGYRQHTDRRYPVLYVQDGQNIFESGSFGSWQAQRSLDRGIRRGEVEEVIVVAVDHTAGRWDDYVPSEDGGANERYARFLSQELKPHIDRTFRTRTGPQDSALLGSSLGGVAALSIAWDHFHQFGKVASLSGSWWLKKFQQRMLGQTRRPLKIYVDSGNSGPYNDCIHHTVALREQLESKLGYQVGRDLCHVVGDQQAHTEDAWGHRLIYALRFLFPAEGAPEERAELPLMLRKAA